MGGLSEVVGRYYFAEQAYAQPPDEIIVLSIKEIMENVYDSVDYGRRSVWATTGARLCNSDECYQHPGRCSNQFQNKESWEWYLCHFLNCEEDRTNDLIASIKRDGFDMEYPIGIDMTESDGWVITEGHHRLAAAIHLGLTEVPTHRWGS